MVDSRRGMRVCFQFSEGHEFCENPYYFRPEQLQNSACLHTSDYFIRLPWTLHVSGIVRKWGSATASVVLQRTCPDRSQTLWKLPLFPGQSKGLQAIEAMSEPWYHNDWYQSHKWLFHGLFNAFLRMHGAGQDGFPGSRRLFPGCNSVSAAEAGKCDSGLFLPLRMW